MASRIEELEKKLAERQAGEKAARKAQDEADEIALLEAKLEHGEHAVAALRLARPAPGLPGLVVIRKPDKLEHKRYRDLVFRQETKKAVEFLQNDCRVYPDDATFARMREEFQSLPDVIATAADKLGSGAAKDEGKG